MGGGEREKDSGGSSQIESGPQMILYNNVFYMVTLGYVKDGRALQIYVLRRGLGISFFQNILIGGVCWSKINLQESTKFLIPFKVLWLLLGGGVRAIFL